MSPQPILPPPRKELVRLCPGENWLLACWFLLAIAVIPLLLNDARLGDLFRSHVRSAETPAFLAAIEFSSRLWRRAPWLKAPTATSRRFITCTFALWPNVEKGIDRTCRGLR